MTGTAAIARDFTPNPTDLGGTLDTTGTAHGGQYEHLEHVTDVFNPKHTEEAVKVAAKRARATDGAAADEDALVAPDAPQEPATGAQKRAARKRGTAKKTTAKKAPAKTAAKKTAPAKRAATKKSAPAAKKTGSAARAARKE